MSKWSTLFWYVYDVFRWKKGGRKEFSKEGRKKGSTWNFGCNPNLPSCLNGISWFHVCGWYTRQAGPRTSIFYLTMEIHGLQMSTILALYGVWKSANIVAVSTEVKINIFIAKEKKIVWEIWYVLLFCFAFRVETMLIFIVSPWNFSYWQEFPCCLLLISSLTDLLCYYVLATSQETLNWM